MNIDGPMRHLWLVAGCVALLAGMGQSCATSSQTRDERNQLPDTLRVGTLYGPTSFFIYRGDTLGYDYDRICDFAKEKGIQLKFTVASNMQSLLAMAGERKVDVLAYEIPVTDEFNQQVLHCGETKTTCQVLVQPKARHRITHVAQLVGRDVYVEKGSKYESRLKELNGELNGSMKIHSIESDKVNDEILMDLVHQRKLPLTIVDSDIAKINQAYYSDIDISLEVSFPQRASWAVNLNENWLADSIDAWSTSKRTLLDDEDVSNHYFEENRTESSNRGSGDLKGKRWVKKAGDISPYDDLFKQYARSTPFEWQFLAAIAYRESNFNPNDCSWAGARGLMQIMPSTAREYGIDPDRLYDPEVSVQAAVRELNQLDRYFSRSIGNTHERMRFVLAAYNSGLAHIIDAVNLAEKYGKDPLTWYGNVEEALTWKSVEKYYSDPVCKYGYFRSTETVNYVHRVEETYEHYRSRY